KIFIKEIHKINHLIQEKGSLIENDTIFSKEFCSEIKSMEKLLKKKSFKNIHINLINEVKEKKRKQFDEEITLKKSKKHKNDIKEEHSKIKKNKTSIILPFIQKNDESHLNNTITIQPDTKTEIINLDSKETNNDKKLRKNNNSEKKLKKNPPYSKIDIPTIEFSHECLKDNSYATAYKNEQNKYGTRANRDLLSTKGKEFRMEKSKRKKGNYHGGKINTNISRSFKFT
ncbi:hypothetical protein PCK1_002118, partial [Pneumocystis canis]